MPGSVSTQAEWPDARLVIVDDEEPIRRMLAEMLRIQGYTDVHTFGDGAEVMEVYEDLDPDLLLLDLHMPGLGGVDVLEQLSGRSEGDRAPVIVMTGVSHRETARQTLALGAADFLSKPVDAIELLLRVRHQLRERRLLKELELHSGQLERLVEERAGELTLLSRVLDEMPLPALVLTDELDLHYANARGEQLLSSAGGDIGQALAADSDQRDRLVQVLRTIGDEPCTLPSTVRASDDRHRRVELSSQRVGPGLVTVLVHDVEEQELTRDTLQRALIHEMETAQRMRNLEELRMRFLTAVSHELRTPLTIILGAAESLDRHDDRLTGDQRDELVSRLHRNATRLHRLLDDLLDLNRLSAGQEAVYAERQDIAALVRAALDEVELEGHELRTDLRTREAPVEARQIQRAVANLVRNAVVHTPTDTPISVSVDGDDQHVRICVADHGDGIADELKERIFEPFEQGPTAPRHQPGTGIGLALVREFVEMHGGTVRARDTPGGGATFVIELPAVGEGT